MMAWSEHWVSSGFMWAGVFVFKSQQPGNYKNGLTTYLKIPDRSKNVCVFKGVRETRYCLCQCFGRIFVYANSSKTGIWVTSYRYLKTRVYTGMLLTLLYRWLKEMWCQPDCSDDGPGTKNSWCWSTRLTYPLPAPDPVTVSVLCSVTVINEADSAAWEDVLRGTTNSLSDVNAVPQ